MANQQNNNLNNGIPMQPNSNQNFQMQIPRPPIQFANSPQNMYLMNQSPIPAGPQVNYSGSPITGPVFQPMPPPAQLPVINQVPRSQQQGSPYINTPIQQPQSVSSPVSQPKKGSQAKKQEGAETHVTRLGLGKILYICNIQSDPFYYFMKRFEAQTRSQFTEEAKCTIALALKFRMVEAVKQSITYTQKRRLTLLPSNIYYTDFPIAQFAKLEAERRIISSGLSIIPNNPSSSSSLMSSFNFGFQGPPLAAKSSSSFFQPVQNQNQQKNDKFDFLNLPSKNSLNEVDEPSSHIETKQSSSSANSSETSTANILERYRYDILIGIAARNYGKKREEITNFIGDIEENEPIIDQTPLKKLLPETEINQNVVIEDVYQYIEGNSVILSRSRTKPQFNLQLRKIGSNMKKKAP